MKILKIVAFITLSFFSVSTFAQGNGLDNVKKTNSYQSMIKNKNQSE